MSFNLKKLGPGLLFAGAAIGVSHLVQSTRAGADYGFGLVWALLAIHLVKYPFFQFGPRYAMATGESLLHGYKKLGRGVLILYILLTITTMFTIQTAVTIVSAGIAASLFQNIISTEIWTVILLAICVLILFKGKYSILDKAIKFIVITLSISTLLAVAIAISNLKLDFDLQQIIPSGTVGMAFLIAFMGWMPAPLDISVWQSLWAIEKQKDDADYEVKSSLFDFNVGYISTIIVGLCFIVLGALVMFHSPDEISPQASVFSGQLINMYTSNLGTWAYPIIGVAAFTTMFSTTLTTLDASPRAMDQSIGLLTNKIKKNGYLIWLIILAMGTIAIFFFLASEMGLLIQIATIVSFLTAPFYAISNYALICSKHTPKDWRPSIFMHIISIVGILFLIAFGIWYLLSIYQ